MKGRVAVLLLLPLCALAPACAGDNPTQPSNNSTQSTYVLSATPPSLILGFGETAQVSVGGAVNGAGAAPPSLFAVSSSNTSVATVSNIAGPFTFTSFTMTVTAVNFGTSTIHVAMGGGFTATPVDIPVGVWPAGTWKGSVKCISCVQGSDLAYLETLQIAVDINGKGTLTAIDTPNFNRQYAITIPSTGAFTGTGAFTYLGTPVTGRINVTAHPTQIDYLETTSYSDGSVQTYQGLLSKQ